MQFITYKTWTKNGNAKRLIIAFTMLLVAIFVLFFMPITEHVVGFAEIVPQTQWSLEQPEPGSFQTVLRHGDHVDIEKIHFRKISSADHLDFELSDSVIEGARITEGACIAVLGSWSTNAELQVLRDEYAVTKANIALLRAGLRPEDIEIARSEFKIAKQKFDAYEPTYLRYKVLHDSSFVADEEYETIENTYLVLNKELELAQSKLKATMSGQSNERIEVEKRLLEKLNQQISYLEKSIAKDEIRAPISGIFVHPQDSTAFCTIAQMDEMTVKILIREEDLMYVLQGGKFTIRPFAMPEKMLVGTIKYVQSRPTMINYRSYFVAIGSIPNADEQLIPGMLATARVYGKQTKVYRYICNRVQNTIFAQFQI